MSFYSKTWGWSQVGRGEMLTAVMSHFDQAPAAKDLGMWNWQWDIRAKQVGLSNDKAIASALRAQLADPQGAIYGALNQMLRAEVPITQEAKFAKALGYAETDDKISGIIETQVDFGMSGFRVASKNTKAEEKIKEWNREHRIYNTLLEAWHVAAAGDNVVIMKQRGNSALTILPLPNLKIIPTHTTDSKGRKQFRTFLKIPKEMKDYILKASRTADQTKRAEALKGIPDKWIKAVRHFAGQPANDPIFPAGGGYVELKEEDGEKIFIINRKGVEDRLVNPSMQTVFASIALRALLQDGEFSIAYLIKYFIHQIKIGPGGEAKTVREMLRVGNVSKPQREEVKNRYRGKIDKAILEVTDQFLTHIFHFPGNDVDMSIRFATPDQRIDWWARISRQIVVGDKGSFSGGLIYLKGYARKISRFRELFAIFLQDIYAEVLGDSDAEVQWDEHFMKEPRQKLREVELLTKRGMDMESACRILGYSWSQFVSDREKTLSPEIMKKKTVKKEAHEYWMAIQTPFFEPNQGLLQDDPGGKPAVDDGLPGDGPEDDNPRPEGVAGTIGADNG